MTTPEADDNRTNQDSRPALDNQSHPSAERREFQARMEAMNGGRQTLAHALIDKFPNFDPTWPAEVQVKWLEGFERLLQLMAGPRR